MEEEKRKSQEPITEAKERNKSTLKRFFSQFVCDEAIGNIGKYIKDDIIIPEVKRTITDSVKNAIDMLIYGKARPSRTRSSLPGTSVSYDKVYRNVDKAINKVDSSIGNMPKKNEYSFFRSEDYIIDDMGAAQEVLERLGDLISTYGTCSVADFIDLIGQTCDYTANNYGWDNIASAKVIPYRGSYYIELPRPKPI